MTKRIRFFYNGLLLALVGFAMRGAALLLGAYISGTVGAEGIGLEALIGTVYSFAVTLATSGVGLSVTRLVASRIGEGRGNGDEILRGAFLYATIFGSLAALLLFILARPIGVYILLDARCVSALRILALSLLPMALSGVISGYFVALRRVTLNAAVQVIGQILRILLTVVLLIRMSGRGVEAALVALSLGSALTEIGCFLIALAEYAVDRRMHVSVRKGGCALGEVSGMALPLAFSQYVRSFLLSVEHALMPRRLIDRGNSRQEALSSYGYLHGMALPIILFPMTPLSSFSGLLVPEFAESEGAKDVRRIERLASEAISKTFAYALVIAVYIFAFAEELGYVIYGTYEAGFFIGFLAPVIPLMYLDHVTDSMLKGIGEHVYSMWVNIADSLLSVILVWLFIPVFDIYGYALVIIIMELFNFVLSFHRLRKRINFRLKPLSGICLAVSALGSVIVSSRVFSFGGESTGAFWLVMKMLFSLSVFLLLALLPKILKLIAEKKTIVDKIK